MWLQRGWTGGRGKMFAQRRNATGFGLLDPCMNGATVSVERLPPRTRASAVERCAVLEKPVTKCRSLFRGRSLTLRRCRDELPRSATNGRGWADWHN